MSEKLLSEERTPDRFVPFAPFADTVFLKMLYRLRHNARPRWKILLRALHRRYGVHVRMNLSRLFIILALAQAGVFSYLQAATAPKVQTAAEIAKVDINTADIPTLEAVPEIGTEFANAVVGGRPFKSVDDLDRVLKVGPEKMRSLKQKVIASPIKPSGPPPARSTPDNRSPEAKPSPIDNGKAKDRKVTEERYDRETERREAGKSEPKK